MDFLTRLRDVTTRAQRMVMWNTIALIACTVVSAVALLISTTALIATGR